MRVITPGISCACFSDEIDEAIASGFKHIYIFTETGVYKRTILAGSNRFIQLKCNDIPKMPKVEIKQDVKFFPAGKLPFRIWEQIYSFFKKVCELKKNPVEAMIWVLWSQEQGYFLFVPEQKVSGASVEYRWDSFPEGSVIILDVHSHNKMAAFFSGTDNSDDRNSITFSGVVGKLDNPECETKWRFNVYDSKIDVKFSDIFEDPVQDLPSIPQEWLDKIEDKTVQTYQGYQGTYAWSGGAYHVRGTDKNYAPGHGSGSVSSNNTTPGKWTASGSINAHINTPASISDRFAKMDQMRENGSTTTKIVNGEKEVPIEAADLFRQRDSQMEEGDRVFAGITVVDDINAEQQIQRVKDDILGDVALKKSQGDKETDSSSSSSTTQKSLGYEGSDLVADEIESPLLGELYAAMVAKYDEKTANAYFAIMEATAVISDHDDLLSEVISDTFQLLGYKSQKSMFREIFEALPSQVQQEIQTNGI